MNALEPSVTALVAAHRSGIRLMGLPVEPSRIEESFLIQDQVAMALGVAIGGWKAGMPETTGPYRAPMYQSGILCSPARIVRAEPGKLGFEAEIAFRFARPLPPRGRPYDRADVLAALASAHAAIELVGSRYGAPVPYLCRLADNQTHGGFVIGPPAPDWRSLDLSNLPVSVVVNGIEVSRAIGGNPSGDPLRPVIWLVNHLAAEHGGIAAGAYVTTGSTTGVEFADGEATVRVAFDGLGVAELALVR